MLILNRLKNPVSYDKQFLVASTSEEKITYQKQGDRF